MEHLKQCRKELQSYLKDRVSGLVELCTVANDLGINLDPGGLLKNGCVVLEEHKLVVKFNERTSLVSPNAKTWSQYWSGTLP